MVLGIGGGLLVRRAVLRRVEMINNAATAIVRGNLSRRVPSRDTTDEFDQLAQTINVMLHQIEQLRIPQGYYGSPRPIRLSG